MSGDSALTTAVPAAIACPASGILELPQETQPCTQEVASVSYSSPTARSSGWRAQARLFDMGPAAAENGNAGCCHQNGRRPQARRSHHAEACPNWRAGSARLEGKGGTRKGAVQSARTASDDRLR